MAKRLLTLMALLALTACGSSTTTGGGGSPSATSSPQQTPTPPSIASLDPCQLVTQQEASQIAGVSFPAGKEQAISSGARMCVYGGQTLNVFTVEVAVASDATSAQNEWAQHEAEAQAGVKQLAAEAGANATLSAGDITISGADRAATATSTGNIGGGQTLSISAIYVLKGAVFFTFADLVLGKPAPALSAMAAQAVTVLTRV